jgi:L-alanine-DL-glutamate epimerase-like enolase superfamily enzyme
MAALPNAGPYVEYSIEGPDYYPHEAGLFDPVLTVRDGRVRVPDGPGWGIEIRRDWLERAAYEASSLA